MTTHTPGPWHLSDETNPLIYSDANRGTYVAQVFAYTDGTTGTSRPQADADARLMAAAPVLLAALRVIANSEELSGDTIVCDFATLQSVARAAIARATGGEA